MPLPQQKFREIIFQMLYSFDIASPEESEIVKMLMKELNVSRKNVFEALVKTKAVLSKKSELDDIIRKLTKEYAFERIQVIEKNILRLGAYEIIYDETIPAKVAIAEGIRLCRKFGTPESASFVNAVLDSIYQMSEGKEVKDQEIIEAFDVLDKQG